MTVLPKQWVFIIWIFIYIIFYICLVRAVCVIFEWWSWLLHFMKGIIRQKVVGFPKQKFWISILTIHLDSGTLAYGFYGRVHILMFCPLKKCLHFWKPIQLLWIGWKRTWMVSGSSMELSSVFDMLDKHDMMTCILRLKLGWNGNRIISIFII